MDPLGYESWTHNHEIINMFFNFWIKPEIWRHELQQQQQQPPPQKQKEKQSNKQTYTLGIQSPCQKMSGMSNHLQNALHLASMKPFSEGEPGSLGAVDQPFILTPCQGLIYVSMSDLQGGLEACRIYGAVWRLGNPTTLLYVTWGFHEKSPI